jgi:malate dehydrogenase (oxaloacetate-decarboxylating)
VFRGALDVFATRMSEEMKIAAAHALADYVPKPHREHIVPAVLDREVTKKVAAAVKEAAIVSGCAREI